MAYALTITDLDPLRYSLLFERFLNPERVSMPDFDIDFCMDRRDEVIDVFFLAGTDDYLLHVAAADTEALRQFVERLNGRPEVAGTTTSLVFEHRRGGAPIF